MSKELRAFRKICKCLSSSYEFTDEYKKNKKLIETALKKQEQDQKLYDKITRANLEIGQNNCRLNELVDKQLSDLTKLETFVEIIKEKKVDLEFLFEEWEEGNWEFALENYNINHEIELTKEDYDLLKEVLL